MAIVNHCDCYLFVIRQLFFFPWHNLTLQFSTLNFCLHPVRNPVEYVTQRAPCVQSVDDRHVCWKSVNRKKMLSLLDNELPWDSIFQSLIDLKKFAQYNILGQKHRRMRYERIMIVLLCNTVPLCSSRNNYMYMYIVKCSPSCFVQQKIVHVHVSYVFTGSGVLHVRGFVLSSPNFNSLIALCK